MSAGFLTRRGEGTQRRSVCRSTLNHTNTAASVFQVGSGENAFSNKEESSHALPFPFGFDLPDVLT